MLPCSTRRLISSKTTSFSENEWTRFRVSKMYVFSVMIARLASSFTTMGQERFRQNRSPISIDLCSFYFLAVFEGDGNRDHFSGRVAFKQKPRGPGNADKFIVCRRIGHKHQVGAPRFTDQLFAIFLPERNHASRGIEFSDIGGKLTVGNRFRRRFWSGRGQGRTIDLFFGSHRHDRLMRSEED